jgi:hypothetical protein
VLAEPALSVVPCTLPLWRVAYMQPEDLNMGIAITIALNQTVTSNTTLAIRYRCKTFVTSHALD